MPTEPRTHEPRAVAKRDLIVETALSPFAERGYQGTKVEDVAAELAISKGSAFQRQRALRIEQFVDLLRRSLGSSA